MSPRPRWSRRLDLPALTNVYHAGEALTITPTVRSFFERLRGSLDMPALEESLRQIVARHEILRTTFRTENGEPQQVIGPPPTDATLGSWEYLRSIPAAQREDEIIRCANAEIRRPFDIERVEYRGRSPSRPIREFRYEEIEQSIPAIRAAGSAPP